jgi:hypothetical protein
MPMHQLNIVLSVEVPAVCWKNGPGGASLFQIGQIDSSGPTSSIAALVNIPIASYKPFLPNGIDIVRMTKLA